MKIRENISLQPYNTLAIPAKVRWFITVCHLRGLKEALAFYHQKNKCPLLVLGGGSNLVLADDFPGVCIQVNLLGRHIEKETNDHVFLSVAAGENWHETVMFCVEKGFYGIENLALIPGNAGAAPMQNIGAYGVELERCLDSVEVMDVETGELSQLDGEQCEFAYRDSIFKHHLKNRVVITRIILRLSKQPHWVLDYPALRAALDREETEVNLQSVVAAVIAIRQSKLPDPAVIPNAGSFFKNPIVDSETYQRLQKDYPDIVAFPHHGGYKLAAGWLLDKAGWRGREVNGFSMHKDQALVLTNPQKQSGQLLLAFVRLLKEDIKTRYQLELDVEPRIVGHD